MRKIYILNKKQNTVSFILAGASGNRVRYEFKGGSVLQNIRPSFITDNLYEQELLEKSAYFQNGTIKLSQVIDDKPSRSSSPAKKLVKVDDVTTPSEAIAWVADTLKLKTTSGLRALETARKHGYDFPHLKA